MTAHITRASAFLVLAATLAAAPATPAAAQPNAATPQALVRTPDVVPPTLVAPTPTAPVLTPALATVLAPGLAYPDQAGEPGPRLFTLDFAATGELAQQSGVPAKGETGIFTRVLETLDYWLQWTVNAVTSGLAPPSPESYARTLASKDPNDFWVMVGDAGYKLKEITSLIGVVPDVGFRFKYIRELSEGDINWLERKLNRHAQKNRDPISFVQRTIIYTLLNINSSDTYYVDELRVKVLPLPQAQFSVMPWESGLSEEHDTLLRAIQGKKRTKRRPSAEESHY